MLTKHFIPPTLAPCGIYCGACPAYKKSCLGCASNDKKQSRRSKWSCRIRNCCYNTNGYDFCFRCGKYPCNIVNKKLFVAHIGDTKFTYRFETSEVLKNLKHMSINEYNKFQQARWKCDICGGTIRFYTYKCDKCDNEKLIIFKNSTQA